MQNLYRIASKITSNLRNAEVLIWLSKFEKSQRNSRALKNFKDKNDLHHSFEMIVLGYLAKKKFFT